MTPAEVAEELRLCKHTVYDHIRRGRIPSVRIGNRIRVPKSKLNERLLNEVA